ncbi:hypothetical protein Metbo_0648 [Methanobacterium lacus]|uniref:Uncharacterized protein n=1 Tax=Methanobacterium lacus (strain AL-21) TaxID=877455 RepID=F0TAE7_METLA|nr:hypothetical protein Metbo_0648 [Methanobacterium lacus]
MITPILLIAIHIWADNNGEIKTAFSFREIFDRIGNIGWKNLIIWSIIIGSVYFVTETIRTNFDHLILGYDFVPLLVIPFLYMLMARSLTIFTAIRKIIRLFTL